MSNSGLESVQRGQLTLFSDNEKNQDSSKGGSSGFIAKGSSAKTRLGLSASSALVNVKSHQCCGISLVTGVVLCASIGSFLFGYNVSLMNTAIGAIGVELGWYGETNRASAYGTFINSAVFVGAAIGAMMGGRLLAIGRRMLLLCVMMVFCLGTVCCTVANSFSALLWARLIAGYAVGVVSVVVPTYMAEMTPAKVRGVYGVFHQLFVTVGIFVGVLLGLALEVLPASAEEKGKFTLRLFDKIWWRCMMGFPIIPICIAMFLLTKMYAFETPHYYIENNRAEEARTLLMLLNDSDDVSSDMEMLFLAKKDRDVAQQIGLNLSTVFKNPIYRRVILIGCVLSAFQQLTGINAFVSRSNSLFTSAGVEARFVTMFTVFMSAVNIVMTFPSMFLIERVGRRFLLLVGVLGMMCSVAPVAVVMTLFPDNSITKILAVVGAVMFIVFFAGSYGPVLWVYLFEIYPMEIKKSASSLATAVNWLCSIVVVFSSGFMNDKSNYISYSVCCLVGVIVIYCFVLETKGRNLQDSPYMTDSQGRPLRINSKGVIV